MNKISHKLILGMLVLTAITIIILWLYQVVFLEAHYLQLKTSEMKKEAATLESLFEDGQLSEFQNRAETITYTKNIGVELLDLDGRIIYSAGNIMVRGQGGFGRFDLRDTVVKNTLAGKEFLGSAKHPRFNTEIILYAKEVSSPGDSSQILLISMPIENISEATEIIKKQIIYIIGVLILLSILIGTFISKTLVKPILKLNQSVQALAAGDLSIRVKSHSRDEIGKLTENFNIMAEELSRIETLRKELIANVSHELRTPLGLIRGYAEMVRDISSEEKRKEHLEVIIQEADRLNGVVNDILDLSQLQSGYISLKREPFDINKLTAQTLEKYSLTADKNNISLSFSGERNEVLIEADASKIEQVLHNLIANALNHTPEGGNIKVSVIKKDSKARIEIQDSGTGISPEDLKHIWERYYKSTKSRKNVIKGTGLGLAIVREILKAHGYDYGVFSQPGKGTVFYFEANIV